MLKRLYSVGSTAGVPLRQYGVSSCGILERVRDHPSIDDFVVIGELSEFWRFFQVKINESQTRERIVEILNS